jgi:probable HAF family extracellular repeat protein
MNPIRSNPQHIVVRSRFRRWALILLICAALVEFAMTPAAGAPATFTPLGLFDGTRSRGFDVSADGSVVVGTAGNFSTNTLRLFHWTAENSRLGPNSHDAAAVSADGAVVVGAQPSGVPPHGVAIRWNADGSVQFLGTAPTLPTDVGSGAGDLSADGTVVVGGMRTLVGNPEAFRWTEATGMVGLGGLPGSPVWSSASGVSADGTVIVGQARGLTMAPNENHAFRWTAETGMVALPRPANATFAGANGISADGSVIIGRMDVGHPPGPPGESQDVAFRWTSATGMVSLGDLPGGTVNSTAFDVSADGSVIVGIGETAAEPGVPSVNEAFYWTTDAGMRNLREVLVSFGATNLDGWLLTEARGVSADGLTVVGTAISPAGVQQAFVATIPEPSTVALVSVAAAALLVVTVRKTWQRA